MPTSSFIAPALNSDFSSEWSDLKLLSTGEYNAIYTAQRFGKRYVLKALREDYRDSFPHQELLRKEFLLGLPLEHTNIVRTIDWGSMESIGNYIQMEYVDGMTLSSFLETKPPFKILRQILIELLTAVEYLHQHQTIHRDIKPSNILITRNGHHVKLIDLGIADADDYVALKQPAGSYAYIAPEQLAGDPLDSRADIYSIGKVMRAMFHCRYWLIARKCSSQQRKHRYTNCARLLAAIRRADRLRLWLPMCFIFGCLSGGAYCFLQQKHQMELQKTDEQVNTLHFTIDSLQGVIANQNETALKMAQSLNDIKEWERIPSEKEMRDFYAKTGQLIANKKEELNQYAQSGKYHSIPDKETFYAIIQAWIDSEKAKIHNRKKQEAFISTINHDWSFWQLCERISAQLPQKSKHE